MRCLGAIPTCVMSYTYPHTLTRDDGLGLLLKCLCCCLLCSNTATGTRLDAVALGPVRALGSFGAHRVKLSKSTIRPPVVLRARGTCAPFHLLDVFADAQPTYPRRIRDSGGLPRPRLVQSWHLQTLEAGINTRAAAKLAKALFLLISRLQGSEPAAGQNGHAPFIFSGAQP